MKRIAFLTACILMFLVRSLPAEVTFSNPDLSEFNRLLFTASTDSPGNGEYKTLFSADLETKKIDQLTFFPERVMYLKETEQLQIQNRFGVFRTDSNLQNMAPVNLFPAFVRGDQIQTGKISPAQASPDGRYLLYLDPVSFGYAKLMLFDIQKGKGVEIAEGVELSLEGPNARWSPNSKFFVYCKGNSLYYYSIDQLQGNRVIAEDFRRLGAGKISSIQWNRDNNLYLIVDSRVYQIFSAEFFTRSIYSGLLEIGTIVGKIPFRFDPNFDNFWISKNGKEIMLNKGGRNIFIYLLSNKDYTTTGEITSLPYLFLPRNTRVKQVLWSENGLLTVLTGSIVNGEDKTKVFRLDLEQEPSDWIFKETDDTGVVKILLSPDERRAALVKNDKVLIKKYTSWEEEKEFSQPKPLQALWKSNYSLIIAGEKYTQLVSVTDDSSKLISFSQVDGYGFSKESRLVAVKVQGKAYEMDDNSHQWAEKDGFSIGTAKVYSKDYRVYIERAFRGSYLNMLKVRDNVGLKGTYSLFNPPDQEYEPFPAQESKPDFSNFSHGSRIRRREVALVFNAIDNVEGLTEVLNTLAEYGVRATFFVNGEFIRRHPDAVKEIALSGHEVGSMFYTYFDMTDSRFRIDKEFIKRGLARNEDDYFVATGGELSLLWHAPYYFVSSDIISASKEMNYTYIGRDVDPLDWVTKEYARSMGGELYYPAPRLVERVLKQKKPGSIIPIRIGKPDGNRDDYLFHKIDILLNGLISLGYSVVPVSTLLEHAR